MGAELFGKTVGIIGFGKVGQLVALKCVQGLNTKVIAYDPYVKTTQIENVKLVDSIDDIFGQSDFITLHLPYKPSLQNFIDQSAFKKMKTGAYIINCARGD